MHSLAPSRIAARSCFSSSRYLLDPAIREEFLGKLTEKTQELKVGPGMDNPDVGPIVSAEQYDKVTGYLTRGRADGARLRTGGNRPRHLQRGYFIEPTIFERRRSFRVDRAGGDLWAGWRGARHRKR